MLLTEYNEAEAMELFREEGTIQGRRSRGRNYRYAYFSCSEGIIVDKRCG